MPGWEKALASAGHVYSLNIPEKLIYMQSAGFALTEVEGSNNGNNNIANYVNIFECVRVKSLRSISSRIIQMLQVYARAYRLYVVTYKICQMLHSWDKLLLASSSTEIHRDSGIIVGSSGK